MPNANLQGQRTPSRMPRRSMNTSPTQKRFSRKMLLLLNVCDKEQKLLVSICVMPRRQLRATSRAINAPWARNIIENSTEAPKVDRNLIAANVGFTVSGWLVASPGILLRTGPWPPVRGPPSNKNVVFDAQKTLHNVWLWMKMAWRTSKLCLYDITKAFTQCRWGSLTMVAAA